MLNEKEIHSLIQSDTNSNKKKLARVGMNYYEANHDIIHTRLFYYDGDGELQEETMRYNAKISHPFFTELVDQETQYLLSNDEFILPKKEDDANLRYLLDINFNSNQKFINALSECVTGAVTKGFDYIYAFKDENGTFSFQQADSLGVVEVSKKEASDNEEHIIYWFIEGTDRENHVIKRIQVWDEKQCYYYKQIDDGAIVEDDEQDINPRPHILYTMGDDSKIYTDTFGLIPFFKLKNNNKSISGLKPIKDLIDDYDLMACGLTNNIQDAQEYIAVVRGFQGEDIKELIQNMKIKKTIGVSEEGGVEFKTVSIPYEARKAKLEIDEKNIYRFGMGLNTAQLGDGNITNVVIKSRYALLDLKCNKLEKQLKSFLEDIVKLVFEDYNKTNGTSYSMNDIYFSFEREVMTNAQDNAQIELIDAQTEQVRISTLLNLAQSLDNETIIKKVCEVLDIDYEDIKDKIPTPQSEEDLLQKAMTEMSGQDE